MKFRCFTTVFLLNAKNQTKNQLGSLSLTQRKKSQCKAKLLLLGLAAKMSKEK